MEENFEISDEAKLELHRALCYYQLTNQENAFLDDLIHQLRRILLMPYSFQIRYKDIRFVQFDRFQYSVHYRIKDDGTITIYHILNQSQDF